MRRPSGFLILFFFLLPLPLPAAYLSGGNAQQILVSTGPGNRVIARAFVGSGRIFSNVSFYAYTHKKACSIASGDINGNGLDEIVCGGGPSAKPLVRAFHWNGTPYWTAEVYPYSLSFAGGVNVACGDLDGDGRDEVVTAAGKGMAPLVRVFNGGGGARATFRPFGSNFKGGVYVACGDVNNDGRDEIITGSGVGASSIIRIFRGDGVELYRYFRPYGSLFTGGVLVACGDVNGDGWDEIITSTGPYRGRPKIKVFDLRGRELSSFYAWDKYGLNGASVASYDLNYDGIDEIIIGTGWGWYPYVKACDMKGRTFGTCLFSAFSKSFRGGANVGNFIIPLDPAPPPPPPPPPSDRPSHIPQDAYDYNKIDFSYPNDLHGGRGSYPVKIHLKECYIDNKRIVSKWDDTQSHPDWNKSTERYQIYRIDKNGVCIGFGGSSDTYDTTPTVQEHGPHKGKAVKYILIMSGSRRTVTRKGRSNIVRPR